MTAPGDRTRIRRIIYHDMDDERDRHATLIAQRHWHACENPETSNETRLAVLVEEVGEVARAINDDVTDDHLMTELVQVGAVVVAWLEGLYAEMVAETWGGRP
ncbi:MAG: hypothetical protein ACRDUW_05050 [Pseudonocardiaceae bacterium]